MTVRNLNYLFKPESVALVGASDRPRSLGATVIANLVDSGFRGAIWPVNPKHRSVAGRSAFRSVADLPAVPGLAVICTPAATVPGIISELGKCGTRAAVVLSGGMSGARTDDGRTLTQAMLEAARPYLLRVLGPNCVGLLVPGINLNASFAQGRAHAGRIAFVSQSGALATAMLDWSRSNGVGFSHFISLGDAADVDFGDVIDYLADDQSTSAILLYIESITSARKFMSAARAAARIKPVIAVKAGRVPEGAKAAASHTGALAGSDDVYDAALARAGVLRVTTTLELFDAAETLARRKPLCGDRLAILTNGGGPGVMATDALIAAGGRLAQFPEAALQQLDAVLPATWSRGNPVDIIGDAPSERYVAALKVLLEDPAADALLFIHAPTAIVASADIARACLPLINASPRNLFACWLGGESIKEAQALFNAAEVPSYVSPEDAVRGFMQLVNYRRSQELLMQTPQSIAEAFTPDTEKARGIVDAVLAEGRALLSEAEAKQLLAAYRIPVVETRLARDVEDAVRVAEEITFPVALKILSTDISHKSDVGGVALNLVSADDVREAGKAMLRRCAQACPEARLSGFTVQRMAAQKGAHELIVGMTTDPVFGPVILFGHGGTGVEVIADNAIGLPPLNLALARDLVSRTRVAKLLDGYRNRPPADRAALHLTLLKVSQLAIDLPELMELDINPVYADERGVTALDARARVARSDVSGVTRLCIRPYPVELEETVAIGGRRVLVRPIRPEDEPQHREFLNRIDREDIRSRFFGLKSSFEHPELARYTQIDYDREMAFIATWTNATGRAETLAVARAIADPDNTRAEFAVLVRSDVKRNGFGRTLVEKLIRYCRERGIGRLTGEVLASNTAMLALCATLGMKADQGTRSAGVIAMAIDFGGDANTP